MKKIFFIVLMSIGIVSCSSSKRTMVIMPKQSYVKWYSKNSLKKYSKEFNRRDWTKRDTVVVPVLDTTLFK
jgi:hypothetical protein